MTEQVSVIVCDHEIDGVHAENDDKEGIEHLEISGVGGYLAPDEVLPYPDHRYTAGQDIKNNLPRSKQTPDMELPGDE